MAAFSIETRTKNATISIEIRGMSERLLVITSRFWTDHGYKLGEHCDWFKHDNYEDATRIVTIIKPGE